MYTDAKLSKMWKLGCPVVNIHEKYPVENIMKTQLKTLNCIVKNQTNKQANKTHTSLGIPIDPSWTGTIPITSWTGMYTLNSSNPMTSSTGNYSISRVFPINQLSSNPS